jgi:hypothetical protein
MRRPSRLDPDAAAPPLHPRFPQTIDAVTERLALGAALAAAHLLGLAAGILLRRLRATNDPLAVALAHARESEIKALLWARTAEILAGRFDSLDPAVGRAVSPPRGSPGDQRAGPGFPVGFLDPERRAFPVLLTA